MHLGGHRGFDVRLEVALQLARAHALQHRNHAGRRQRIDRSIDERAPMRCRARFERPILYRRRDVILVEERLNHRLVAHGAARLLDGPLLAGPDGTTAGSRKSTFRSTIGPGIATVVQTTRQAKRVRKTATPTSWQRESQALPSVPGHLLNSGRDMVLSSLARQRCRNKGEREARPPTYFPRVRYERSRSPHPLCSASGCSLFLTS